MLEEIPHLSLKYPRLHFICNKEKHSIDILEETYTEIIHKFQDNRITNTKVGIDDNKTTSMYYFYSSGFFFDNNKEKSVLLNDIINLNMIDNKIYNLEDFRDFLVDFKFKLYGKDRNFLSIDNPKLFYSYLCDRGYDGDYFEIECNNCFIRDNEVVFKNKDGSISKIVCANYENKNIINIKNINNIDKKLRNNFKSFQDEVIKIISILRCRKYLSNKKLKYPFFDETYPILHYCQPNTESGGFFHGSIIKIDDNTNLKNNSVCLNIINKKEEIKIINNEESNKGIYFGFIINIEDTLRKDFNLFSEKLLDIRDKFLINKYNKNPKKKDIFEELFL